MGGREDTLVLQVRHNLLPLTLIERRVLFIGITGWGISWYLNGLLIPKVELYRGFQYTFIVEGGSDPSNPAQYHPFYITSSDRGGLLAKSEEEQQVFQIMFIRSLHRLYSGVKLLLNVTLNLMSNNSNIYYRKKLYMLGLMLTAIQLEVNSTCISVLGYNHYTAYYSWSIL